MFPCGTLFSSPMSEPCNTRTRVLQHLRRSKTLSVIGTEQGEQGLFLSVLTSATHYMTLSALDVASTGAEMFRTSGLQLRRLRRSPTLNMPGPFAWRITCGACCLSNNDLNSSLREEANLCQGFKVLRTVPTLLSSAGNISHVARLYKTG